MALATARSNLFYWQGFSNAVAILFILSSAPWVTPTESVCLRPVSNDVYLALYSLYNSTHGQNWNWEYESGLGLTKWNFSNVTNVTEGAARPCRDNWLGIICAIDAEATELCMITSLELVHQNLRGPLPPDISNMTSLVELYLAANSLSSTIPSSMGTMSNLELLLFDSNAFTGTVPSELGGLSSCTYLELAGSHFTGQIPSEIFKITGLTTLYLYDNSLTGTIPSTIGKLTGLEELFLDENCLSGQIPSEVGLLTGLINIELSQNHFTSTIPTEVGALSDMQNFYLFQSHMSGSLPTELGLLRKLRFLSFDLNMLSGSIPTEFGNMLLVEQIDIYANSLTGLLPAELGNLFDLTTLSVDQNILTGPIPTEYGNIGSLRILYVNNNQLTGPIPVVVAALGHMLEFVLSTNLFTSTLPTNVSTMITLQDFSVSTNYFTGPVPPLFPGHLQILQLNDNYCSGQFSNLFPVHARDLYLELVLVDFADNGFTGSFPSSLFTLPVLHTLSGSRNCFSGELVCGYDANVTVSTHPKIPTVPLTVIDLNGLSSGIGCRNYILPRSLLPTSGYYPENYIRGSIPSCFWSLQNLTALYLAGNGFTGSISYDRSLSSLIASLENLTLASNEITGTIPRFIQLHDKFLQVDISSNRFRGTLALTDINQSFLLTDLCSTASSSLKVDVSVNRLSGSLGSLVENCDWNTVSENILRGNMFTFSMSGMDPQMQSDALAYYGSYILNISMIVASPQLLLAVCLLIVYFASTNIFGRSSSPFQSLRAAAGEKVTASSSLRRWTDTIYIWYAHWQIVILPVEDYISGQVPATGGANDFSFGVSSLFVYIHFPASEERGALRDIHSSV
jgi:Leucine-rich repeat (LRR) protein